MSDRLLHVMMALVRGWTRVYTSGLPAALAAARREDIASDLWESAHDADRRRHLPLAVAARLLCGVPDDLRWRLEQEDTMTKAAVLRFVLPAGLVGVLALGFVVSAGTPDPLLPLPPAPRPMRVHPVPPPPPPAPGAAEPDAIPRILGEATYAVAGSARHLERVKDVPPVYPPIAVWYGVSGRVGIEATIDDDGRVANARVIEPAHWVLNQSALHAARQWEFVPGRQPRTRAPVTIVATVTFKPPR